SATRTDQDVLVQGSVSSDLSRAVVIAVRNWLTDRYGESVVFGSGGLKVITTIDVQAQVAANQASLNAEIPEGAQMAIVGIDPSTGAVLAMVGQKLEEGQPPGEFNRATQALRQPGSSFKPIVYATAIEQGGYNQATVLVDAPATFEIRGQPPYEPKNHDNAYDGPQTVRAHLNRSRNIPTVKTLEAATATAVAEKARELGYDVQPYPAMALGSFEVTPLQHTAAIAAFANGGVYIEPYFIQRVEDSEGNVIYEAAPHSARVWSEETAYIMLDLMHGNVVDRDPATGFSNRASVPGRFGVDRERRQHQAAVAHDALRRHRGRGEQLAAAHLRLERLRRRRAPGPLGGGRGLPGARGHRVPQDRPEDRRSLGERRHGGVQAQR